CPAGLRRREGKRARLRRRRGWRGGKEEKRGRKKYASILLHKTMPPFYAPQGAGGKAGMGARKKDGVCSAVLFLCSLVFVLFGSGSLAEFLGGGLGFFGGGEGLADEFFHATLKIGRGIDALKLFQH